MQTFTIYPKDGGETFTAQFHKFELNESGDGFILYDDAHKPSKEGHLSFKETAAIIPNNLKEREDEIRFLVYLKNRSEPLTIYAHAFEQSEPSLIFKRQLKDIRHNPYQEWKLDAIYIALSEVIAVLPADGLISYRP
jgi:hypothetical protein